MNRLKMALFPCVLIIVLATFLLRPVVAQAVSPGACGNWSIAPSPNVPSRENYFSAVSAVSANDVWAVGADSRQGGNAIFTLIEHWNGTQWSIIKSPNPDSNINALTAVSAVSANDVWAVGYSTSTTLIVHWDGKRWQSVTHPGPPSGYLLGVTALSANDVWAVGYFLNSSRDNRTLVEHWDGVRWSIVPSPSPGLINNILESVTAVSANNVWAVGETLNHASPYNTLIEHWDGAQWSIVASPNSGTNNALSGVTAVSASDIWAVGSKHGGGATLTEHWDGTKWSIVASPGSAPFIELVGVVALSSQNVWAVGSIVNNAYLALIEHWDGTKWSVVPNPSSGVQLAGVTVVPNSSDLWAVGHIYIGNVTNTLTEFYC